MANDAILVERSIRIMPGRHEKKEGNPKDNKDDNVASKSLQNDSVKRSSFFSKHGSEIIVSVVSGILVAAFLGCINLFVNVTLIRSEVSTITGSIGDLRTDLSSTEIRLRNEIVQSKKDTKEYIDFLQDYMIFLNETIYQSTSTGLVYGYAPTESFQNTLTTSYGKIDSPIFERTSLVSYDTLVVKNVSDGRELSLGEVVGKKLLLPYSDENGESIFYGQISKNGNWDGHCIINTYKEDKLELITDAQFADGTLINCHQVFPYQTDKEGDVWAVSSRTKFEGFSTGDTVYVKRSADYIKEFALEQATVENIITAKMFTESFLASSPMVGYYHGNISDGRFNDSTGDAYLAKFFEDGTVRMLYQGRIKNGDIADSHDEGAWFIGREQEDTIYSYYSGPFKNGHPTKDEKYWKDVSQDEIQEILDKNLILHQWDWDVPNV